MVAVDIWTSHWAQSRVVLKVRGDNVGALALVKMRPANSKQAIIARELALRLVELSFPTDAVHTTGVARVVADMLSRVFAHRRGRPSGQRYTPGFKKLAVETSAPIRNAEWYRALE